MVRSFPSVVRITPEAGVHVAHPVRVGDAHVGEEHLVEPRGPGHLAQRAHLHARRVHVDEERREALVLGHVGIGPAHRERDVGDVRARRPHLLAVHHPLVAVTHGAGRSRREVGAGVRLAEELAHHEVAAVELRQVRGAQLGRRVREQRGTDEPDGDDEHGEVRELVARLELLIGARVLGGQAPAAVLDRAVDPAEPGVEARRGVALRLGELRRRLRRVDLLEDVDPVGPLAPDEPLGGLVALRAGPVEEPAGLREELARSTSWRPGLGQTWVWLIVAPPSATISEPGDPLGLVGGEPHRGVGDVAGLAHPVQLAGGVGAAVLRRRTRPGPR